MRLFTTQSLRIHSGSLQSMQTPDLKTSLLSMYLEGSKLVPRGQRDLSWERLPGLQIQVPWFHWPRLSPENHMFCLMGQNRQASWPPSGLCSLATVRWVLMTNYTLSPLCFCIYWTLPTSWTKALMITVDRIQASERRLRLPLQCGPLDTFPVAKTKCWTILNTNMCKHVLPFKSHVCAICQDGQL